MTAVAPAGSDCPRWQRFLHQVTDGEAELTSFLRRIAGYGLTGSTCEHALFFLYGTGANGKSVFVNTISAILGGYATNAPMDTFMATQGERHPHRAVDVLSVPVGPDRGLRRTVLRAAHP